MLTAATENAAAEVVECRGEGGSSALFIPTFRFREGDLQKKGYRPLLRQKMRVLRINKCVAALSMMPSVVQSKRKNICSPRLAPASKKYPIG